MLTIDIIHMLVHVIRAFFICLAGNIKQSVHAGLEDYQRMPKSNMKYAHFYCICSLMPHVDWEFRECHILVDGLSDQLNNRLGEIWPAICSDLTEQFRFGFGQCFM